MQHDPHVPRPLRAACKRYPLDLILLVGGDLSHLTISCIWHRQRRRRESRLLPPSRVVVVSDALMRQWVKGCDANARGKCRCAKSGLLETSSTFEPAVVFVQARVSRSFVASGREITLGPQPTARRTSIFTLPISFGMPAPHKMRGEGDATQRRNRGSAGVDFLRRFACTRFFRVP